MKLPILLLAVLVSLPADAADSATSSNVTDAALLEQGKKIFVARCAKCHDNDATRKLPDGTTLLGRLAKIKEPEARLGNRLKDPQERHAVMVYVEPSEGPALFERITTALANIHCAPGVAREMAAGR